MISVTQRDYRSKESVSNLEHYIMNVAFKVKLITKNIHMSCEASGDKLTVAMNMIIKFIMRINTIAWLTTFILITY